MKELEKFIEEVEEKAAKWDISAVVSLRDREGTRYERAFGYADREQGRLLTVTDRFSVDAETGFFLTLCVMDLAEEKKLRLSDRIGLFLPEYKHGQRVTVRHLLRWTSGIEDYWSAGALIKLQNDPEHRRLDDKERFRREAELYARGMDFQDVLATVGELELTHAPGSDQDGSTSTIAFLAEIIRRLSGMAPREYLFKRFFEPLGMTETRPGNDATVALYAMFRDTDLVRLPRLSPPGVFTTTARDMGLLASALLEKRFFSGRAWAEILKCDAEGTALGFIRRGELYCADLFQGRLRYTCQICLCFEDGDSIIVLQSEEQGYRMDSNNRWSSFGEELRRAWQDTRVYPKNPELKRVNGRNIWDVLDVELSREQLRFVPECSRCVATSLARKRPVYMLTDHGLAVGMVALTVKPAQNEYAVDFLQVDRRYQGRGYGRILLTRAVDILREKGASTLKIGVNRANAAAIGLYHSVGFRDYEIYDDFIEMKMDLK